MKIGFDARFYAEAGGIGRYIRELIAELEKQDSINEYLIFINKKGDKEYQPTNPNFKKVVADIPWYGLREQFCFKAIIKKQKIDLMHFPHWNIPFLFNDPFVVTIHDLILLHFPSRRASTLGLLTYWIKNLAYKMVLRHAVYKSKKILSPSKFVKEDILEKFKIEPQKIIVSHEGHGYSVGQARFQNKQMINLQKYSLNKPYLLYVGAAFPHKNLEGLIKAFQIFQNKYSKKYQLVLTGKRNYFYNQLLSKVAIKRLNDIIFTDYLPDNELSTLYQGASAYIFPSFYEGFGLPPLEAMAQGVPVIASKTSCLPEILGKAALYFDPTNPEDMAESINRILNDDSLRQELKKRGFEQIKRFSWAKCAQLTLQTYKNSV